MSEREITDPVIHTIDSKSRFDLFSDSLEEPGFDFNGKAHEDAITGLLEQIFDTDEEEYI
jgi:hypothetical protein